MDLQNEVTRILAKARFKYRSDTLENWENENPVLLSGEIGVVIDGTETEKVKWGDGATPWKSLGWWKGPKGEKGEKGDKGENNDPQLFANALKGNIKGVEVSADDVSPIEHNLDVTLENKNMFSVGTVADYEVKHTKITVGEVNTITGIVEESAIAHCYKLTNYESGIYTISYLKGVETPRLLIRCFDNNGNVIDNSFVSLSGGTYNNFYSGWVYTDTLLTITIPETVAYWQIGVSFTGTTKSDCAITWLLIERGKTEGIYVPPVDFSTVAVTVRDNHANWQTVNANLDGTVKGLKSYSPYMVILTDNPNVFVNCVYNKDLNAAIGDIETLLGGI